MSDLIEARMTVAEAAFVSGLRAADINREIDAKIVPVAGRPERTITGRDVVYLSAVRDFRSRADLSLRRDIHKAITEAVSVRAPSVRVFSMVFPLAEIAGELLESFQSLQRSKQEFIESRSDVLGGEPVIRGTRIAARHVDELLRSGSAKADICEDLDLTQAQVDAAAIFSRTTPKRGRPSSSKLRTPHVSSA